MARRHSWSARRRRTGWMANSSWAPCPTSCSTRSCSRWRSRTRDGSRVVPLPRSQVFQKNPARFLGFFRQHRAKAGVPRGGGSFFGEGRFQRTEGQCTRFDQAGVVVLGGIEKLVYPPQNVFRGLHTFRPAVNDRLRVRKLKVRSEGVDQGGPAIENDQGSVAVRIQGHLVGKG